VPPEKTEAANVSIQDVVDIQQTTFIQRLFASQPFWITVALLAIIVFMSLYEPNAYPTRRGDKRSPRCMRLAARRCSPSPGAGAARSRRAKKRNQIVRPTETCAPLIPTSSFG